MGDLYVNGPDKSRSAVIYLTVGDNPVYRTRLHKHPESYGWAGGRVLWGHDKSTEAEAYVLAHAWVEHGELPEGMIFREVTLS